jgi:transcriptional/translational regulatory protein YebC/TACO1
VAYLFNKQGFISFASGDEDQIMEVALDVQINLFFLVF